MDACFVRSPYLTAYFAQPYAAYSITLFYRIITIAMFYIELTYRQLSMVHWVH